MSTDTRISSFFVPETIWLRGYAGRPDLPPLALPARDALDIERRAQKRVNLRNETRRYTLCCEQMEGIVQELSREPGLLPQPIIWPAHQASAATLPTARAYLGLIDVLSLSLRGSPYPRVAKIFFPPEDARRHFQIVEAIRQHKELELLLQRAVNTASLPGSAFRVTVDQCRSALDQRYKLAKTAALEGYGLVDAVSLG